MSDRCEPARLSQPPEYMKSSPKTWRSKPVNTRSPFGAIIGLTLTYLSLRSIATVAAGLRDGEVTSDGESPASVIVRPGGGDSRSPASVHPVCPQRFWRITDVPTLKELGHSCCIQRLLSIAAPAMDICPKLRSSREPWSALFDLCWEARPWRFPSERGRGPARVSGSRSYAKVSGVPR
jgi:hypothetical protein